MSALVRPPRDGDAKQLGPLHNHVWRVAYADLMPRGYLASRSDEESTRRWEQITDVLDADGRDADGHRVLVAEDDGRLVGFLMVGPGRDPQMQDFVELMSLYVHPDRHGTGVAQNLTDVGLPGGPSYLWVLDGNGRAQAFYRKLGYLPDGSTTSHPPTGAVELRMVRS